MKSNSLYAPSASLIVRVYLASRAVDYSYSPASYRFKLFDQTVLENAGENQNNRILRHLINLRYRNTGG